jgi:sec-independent protein translocase protein TatC
MNGYDPGHGAERYARIGTMGNFPKKGITVSMFGLLCIGTLALLILGPEKFSGLAHQLGRALSEFKHASADFRSQLEKEARQADPAKRIKQLYPADTDDVDVLVDCEATSGSALARAESTAHVDKEAPCDSTRSSDTPVSSLKSLPKASFWEHLQELRKRFLYSLVSVGVGFAACWYFAERIFALMQKPIVEALGRHHFDQQLVYLSPTEPFNLYLKIGMLAGILLASPFLLYQLWMFVSPALYRHEKRFVVPFLISTVALLLCGALFGYTTVYPAALEFLIGYGAQFRPTISIGVYTDLFLTTILGLTFVFELPVVMGLLGVMGVVSANWLWRNLRYSILLIFIVAGIITPTSDILNMCIFAAPMVGLYLLSIVIVWAVDPRRRKTAALVR